MCYIQWQLNVARSAHTWKMIYLGPYLCVYTDWHPLQSDTSYVCLCRLLLHASRPNADTKHPRTIKFETRVQAFHSPLNALVRCHVVNFHSTTINQVGTINYSMQFAPYLKQNYSFPGSMSRCMHDGLTVIGKCEQGTPTPNTHLTRDFQMRAFHEFERVNSTRPSLCTSTILSELWI